VFGSNLFINGKYAYFGWGYGFTPRGGGDKDGTVDVFNDQAHGSWFTYTARKPWHIVDVSGSAFKSSGGGNHEFRFGFGYRKNPNHSTTRWSGSETVGYINAPDDKVARAYRARVVNFVGENYNAFFGDTFSKGRLTANGGIRWDRQKAANDGSTAPGNTAFPDLLPSLTFNGGGPTIDWNDISPRVGITYALDEKRRTVARASYARYAGQMNPFEVTASSPVGGYYTFIAYKWVDTNRDGFAQKNEILTNLGPQYSNNIDPAHPTSASSVNTIDPKYHANHDNEFIAGVDHELMPNFAVGAAYTFRRTDDLPTWNPRIGLTSADYTIAATQTGNGLTATTYAPNQALVDASGGGRMLTNRPDYYSTYSGLEFTLNKRLSNRWMARVALSFNDITEHFTGPGAVQNPTRTDYTSGPAGSGTLSGPQVDGGQIAPRSGGSGKGDLFYNAKWQLNANGFYQLGYGFDIGANIFARQGYPDPYIFQLGAGADGNIRALAVSALDDVRNSNLFDLDLRLAKSIRIQKVNFQLAADLFNVTNAGTVLQRNRNLASSVFNSINEIISPRILRVGVKFTF